MSTELQLVQMISQVGAVGLLLVILWKMPAIMDRIQSMFLSLQQERMAERQNERADRNLDRDLHEKALATFTKAIDSLQVAFSERNNKVVGAIETQTAQLTQKIDSQTSALSGKFEGMKEAVKKSLFKHGEAMSHKPKEG